jgi:2-oxoisovalerate dehydrogenase E1 component
MRVRAGTARCSSSSAPTASAPTRCSTRELYRDKAEVERWKARGPIVTFTAARSQGSHRGRLPARSSRRAAEVDAAVAFAEAGTWEPVEDLLRHVAHEPGRRGADGMSTTHHYREALREAHARGAAPTRACS